MKPFSPELCFYCLLLASSATVWAGCKDKPNIPDKQQVASNSRPADAPNSSAVPHDKTAPSFYRVAQLESNAKFVTLNGAAFVVGESVLAEIQSDDLRFDPQHLRGLTSLAMLSISGHWPEDAWLVSHLPTNANGLMQIVPEPFRWNDGWHYQKPDVGTMLAYETATWQNMPLVLEAHLAGECPRSKGIAWSALASRFVVPGHPDRVVPVPACVANKTGCAAVMRPEALATLPTGHVFVLGTPEPCGKDKEINFDIGDDSGFKLPMLVERWAPGEVHGHVDKLEGCEPGNSPRLFARTPTELYVTNCGPRIAKNQPLMRFDGSQWHRISWEGPEGNLKLVAAPGGPLFALSSTAIWRKDDDSEVWQKLPFPVTPTEEQARTNTLRIEDAWLRGPDDLWVIVAERKPQPGRYEQASVYHSRAPTKTVELPSDQQIEALLSRNIRPADPMCQSLFVVLYELNGKEPDKDSYPKTRAALASGERLGVMAAVEYEVDGKRFFGLSVDSYQDGNRLVARIKAKLPGASPQFQCRQSPPGREVQGPW